MAVSVSTAQDLFEVAITDNLGRDYEGRDEESGEGPDAAGKRFFKNNAANITQYARRVRVRWQSKVGGWWGILGGKQKGNDESSSNFDVGLWQ